MKTSTIAGYVAGAARSMVLLRRPERGDHILDRHAHAVVRIDEARGDDAVGADDEGGRDRQHPILGALGYRRVPAATDHRLLRLVADPKCEVQGHGIAVVD